MKQNKFLTGFLIVTLLGAAALGYLAFSAKSAHDETAATYDSKLAELQGLQTQNPYPDDENLKNMQELQKAHQASIDDLQKQLAAMEIPLESIKPAAFQDELNKTVKRVLARAQDKGVLIGGTPEKQGTFYMAFEKYQAEPPTEQAAAPLLRMLKAMEIAVNSFIDASPKGAQLVDLSRTPLPEEGGAASPSSSKTKEKEKDKDKGKELVKRHAFEMSFVTPEQPFRSFVNRLINEKTQFFIPKSIKLENQQTKGPSKASATAGAGFAVPPPVSTPEQPIDPNNPANPAAPAPAAAESKTINFVVGTESQQVAMRIEVADFEQPAPAADKKK